MEDKKESSIDICAICQNNIDYKKSVLTSCNHYFCSTCFFRWMEKKADCPVCRKVFREQTNYDIEVEREILEQLEGEVRDYTNLVDELREQAFNIEYKRNSMLKICYEMDETIKNKKQEFNKLTDEIRNLVNTRTSLSQDIQKNSMYLRQLEQGFNRARARAKQRKQFGLNLR